MRKLITTTFLSLDGVMQAPGGPAEDEDQGFAHGGWSFTFWDDVLDQAMGEIMGKPLNDATKYVASRGRPSLDWGPSVRLEGDAADAIAALKATDGPELQVHGSGNLIQTLLRHGLVDEFHVWVFPVVIGSGKRLFADGAIPAALKLVDSRVSTTGVIIGTYVPAGELVTGSFA